MCLFEQTREERNNDRTEVENSLREDCQRTSDDEPCREISARLRFGENMYLNAIFNDLFTEIKQRYECRRD